MPAGLKDLRLNKEHSKLPPGFLCNLLESYFNKVRNEFYPEDSAYFPQTYQESKQRGISLAHELVYAI